MRYGRAAQDNEYQHLRVDRGEGAPGWQPRPSFPHATDAGPDGRVLPDAVRHARACGTSAAPFLLNAEFEDHAEHTYAELVEQHPEWEEQPVTGDAVRSTGSSPRGPTSSAASGSTSANHRNASFAFAGMPEHVVNYEGMPETPGL